MTSDLRALGIVHGLLLGLLLATPLVAPDLMPWGVEALFILGGFQLRLADRRWTLRAPLARHWVSHIRMGPIRLLPWGAAATVALIAGDALRAQAIFLAAGACELLLYPILAPMLSQCRRSVIAALLILLMAVGATMAGEAVRYMLGFAIGLSAGLFWLRGPDGDARALALAVASSIAAGMCAVAMPVTAPAAVPAAIVFAALSLAHLSVQRRRPVPWRPGSATSFMRRANPLR